MPVQDIMEGDDNMEQERKNPGRLLITGDTHGDTAALRMLSKQLLPGDMLFVAGDFGFVFRDDDDERAFLDDMDGFLQKTDGYIIFVDGNHEHHRALNAFPVEEWNGARVHRIRSRIIHVLRGEILQLKGKRIFCFGGAFSIDRAYRELNKTYWEEEIPTDQDYQNGNQNLGACNYQIDYAVTHTCPLDLIRRLGGYHAAAEERQLQNYLQYVSDMISSTLKKWYFGHWHRDMELGEKFRVIYLDLVDMETGEKIW